MITEIEHQSVVDGEHLKLLSIGYWVWGGIMAAYSVLMGAYFGFFGLVFLSAPAGADAPPDFFRWFFPAIGVLTFLVAGSVAGLQIANGFWIRRRTHRVLSMVIAGFSCMSVPVGTMLGVSTLVVLSRPSVRSLYEQSGRFADSEVPAKPGDASQPPMRDGSPT